jgi:uncharacterized protein YbjT (DUF2867 family)
MRSMVPQTAPGAEWLVSVALLLVRVAGHATNDTWRNLRHELDRMHLVTLVTSDGRLAKRTATTTRQRELFAALDVREPAQLAAVSPAHGLFLGDSHAYELSKSGQSWAHARAVELATASSVEWWNTERPYGPLGHLPPAEYEASFIAAAMQLSVPPAAA